MTERGWRVLDILATALSVGWFLALAYWMKQAADAGHIGDAMIYQLVDVCLAVRYFGRGRR